MKPSSRNLIDSTDCRAVFLIIIGRGESIDYIFKDVIANSTTIALVDITYFTWPFTNIFTLLVTAAIAVSLRVLEDND